MSNLEQTASNGNTTKTDGEWSIYKVVLCSKCRL